MIVVIYYILGIVLVFFIYCFVLFLMWFSEVGVTIGFIL